MRLIDVDALKARIEEYGGIFERCCVCLDPACAQCIASNLDAVAPTVDAVPVVRCKDCKYSRPMVNLEKQIYVDGCLACRCSDASQNGYMIVFPEHFCSYGEREEATNDR